MASVAELAEHFGRTKRRIGQLVDEGMPQIARGEYDLVACSAWYIRYLQRKLEERGPAAKHSEDVAGFRAEKHRMMKLQADEKELAVLEARRRLIPIDESIELLDEMISRLRTRILGIPGKYAQRVIGVGSLPAAQQTLEALADDLMSDLRTAAEGLDDDGGPDAEAVA